MNTKTAKPKDFPYILAERLEFLTNSPAQFIKENQIISHNLPNNEQVRLELASPPGTKIELIYDLGVYSDTSKDKVVHLKTYRITITRGKNIVQINGLKNFSHAANCSQNDIIVALHFIYDELTDELYKLARETKVKIDTITDGRQKMHKILKEAGIENVTGYYDHTNKDVDWRFIKIKPKGTTFLADHNSEALQNLIYDCSHQFERGRGEFRWDVTKNRIDISHTKIIEIDEEHENI